MHGHANEVWQGWLGVLALVAFVIRVNSWTFFSPFSMFFRIF